MSMFIEQLPSRLCLQDGRSIFLSQEVHVSSMDGIKSWGSTLHKGIRELFWKHRSVGLIQSTFGTITISFTWVLVHINACNSDIINFHLQKIAKICSRWKFPTTTSFQVNKSLVCYLCLCSQWYSCPRRTSRIRGVNSNNEASLHNKSLSLLPFSPSGAVSDTLRTHYTTVYLVIYGCRSQWFLCHRSYACTCHNHELWTIVGRIPCIPMHN